MDQDTVHLLYLLSHAWSWTVMNMKNILKFPWWGCAVVITLYHLTILAIPGYQLKSFLECAFLQCSIPPFYLPHDPCLLNALSYMLNRIEWAGICSVSFRKMDKGGKIILRENLGGAKGLCMAVLPLGGSGGMPPPGNFWILDPLRSLLVHFSDHLWFQMTWWDDHISSADKTYRLSYTGADKALRSNCWIVTSKAP